MKKAIIFGINGMDAKTLTHFLLTKDYEVVGTYRRNTLDTKLEIAPLFNHDERVKFEYCDVNDFSSVKELLTKHADVSEVYLLACQSHVGISFSSASTSIQNGASVFNVLENVKNINSAARVYFAGTSELMGGENPPEKGYNEESPYDCRSPYAIGKELGTRWVKYYRQLGLFCCYGILFNHSNIYRGAEFYIRRVTSTAARIASGKESSLVLGNLDFYRDEHWSDFGCEMMWKMLQQNTPKDYVIANGVAWHGEQYLDEAFGYFNLDWKKYVKIDKSRFRPNEVVKLIGDSSAAQKDLGWIPERISFRRHIEMMCKWDFALENGQKPEKINVFI
jgi:GDPmannose 4,6-dehydratase